VSWIPEKSIDLGHIRQRTDSQTGAADNVILRDAQHFLIVLKGRLRIPFLLLEETQVNRWYPSHPRWNRYALVAFTASKKKNMLSKFLRSAIQATDSTFMGCSANNAATMRLRPVKPVARCSIQNKSRHSAHATGHWCRGAAQN
jgi:hypothetical protein